MIIFLRTESIQILTVLALIGMGSLAPIAAAQSGSQSRPPIRQPAARQPAVQGSDSRPIGSGSRSAENFPLGLQGFCPVSLAETKQWVRGDARIHTAYDGHLYHFPSIKAQRMFQASPERYVPVLGGDDVVQYAGSGQRVRGNLSQGLKQNGRLYFFANDENKRTFQENPNQYVNIDLALRGDCVVCQKEMQKRMSGNPQVTIIHGGIRYQFAGAQQRNTFLSNRAKYTMMGKPAAPGSGTAPAGSNNRAEGSQRRFPGQ